MSAFSERIRRLRNGENQAIFAARFGLKVAVYSHYETGRREPSLDTIILMARILNVSTDFLLGLDAPSPAPTAINVNASGSAVVAAGQNATAIGGTTSPRNEKNTKTEFSCAACPFKKAVSRLKKAGVKIDGL